MFAINKILYKRQCKTLKIVCGPNKRNLGFFRFEKLNHLTVSTTLLHEINHPKITGVSKRVLKFYIALNNDGKNNAANSNNGHERTIGRLKEPIKYNEMS